MNFFHPEMEDINPILRSVYRPTINDYIKDGKYIPWWKRITAVAIIRVIMIVIGPAVSLIDLIHKLGKRVMNIILKRYEDESYDYLYLFNIEGAGEVSCMLCTFTSKLIGKIHGGTESDLLYKGYQCQSCGRFHELEYPDRLYQLPRCECGGELSRDEFFFCPECRSEHMVYDEQYVSGEPNKPDIYTNLISPG